MTGPYSLNDPPPIFVQRLKSDIYLPPSVITVKTKPDVFSLEFAAVIQFFNTLPDLDNQVAQIVENYLYQWVDEIQTHIGSDLGISPNHFIEKLEQRKCSYRISNQNVRDGVYKRWYSNGQLEKQCWYVNGIKHGEYLEWYRDGTLCKQKMFDMGRMVGKAKHWFPNQILAEECQYDPNGALHGTQKMWYDNGMIEYECEYVNGIEGETIWYTPGGVRY